jgi:hypothetical protein
MLYFSPTEVSTMELLGSNRFNGRQCGAGCLKQGIVLLNFDVIETIARLCGRLADMNDWSIPKLLEGRHPIDELLSEKYVAVSDDTGCKRRNYHQPLIRHFEFPLSFPNAIEWILVFP